MTIDPDTAEHLHSDDYPQTLVFLAGLLDRPAPPAGYERTERGALVDWDQLTEMSWLSSTEIAAVHIAHGCAILERHGGAGPHTAALVDLVRGVA